MSRVLTAAADEWRYWFRSNLALAAMLLVALLLAASAVLTAQRMVQERHVRLHQQQMAEETFLAQPDRHPHRMVHYGHYVFRAPAPLAVFDPGLDPVTGQAIFLEGHRQNSATFADAIASAELGGMALLTPALVYQLFVPLLIILLGHSAIVREREAGTLAPLLAQGIRGPQIVTGKAIALVLVVALLLIPLALLGGVAAGAGEDWTPIVAMLGLYGGYLLVWVGLTLAASALFRLRRTVLAGLTTMWFAVALIVPGAAVNAAGSLFPSGGKLEADLRMLTDLRKLGDGHNAADPAFARLRAELLAEHGVSREEDLPMNVRGIVAQYAEEKLTKVLNDYAEARMANEAGQAGVVRRFGWLSPVVATAFASRAIAGTDLAAYHRFLREAEAVRFDFVQSLNRVHAEQLAYIDDIQRGGDAAAERRTRVSAQNWAVLDTYRFEPSSAGARLQQSAPSALMLSVWLVFAGLACAMTARKLNL